MYLSMLTCFTSYKFSVCFLHIRNNSKKTWKNVEKTSNTGYLIKNQQFIACTFIIKTQQTQNSELFISLKTLYTSSKNPKPQTPRNARLFDYGQPAEARLASNPPHLNIRLVSRSNSGKKTSSKPFRSLYLTIFLIHKLWHLNSSLLTLFNFVTRRIYIDNSLS